MIPEVYPQTAQQPRIQPSGGEYRHRERFLAPVPRLVWIAALAAALLHIAPFWHAWKNTPPGWEFSWNIHDSPDFIQYRAWMRISQQTGVLVSNNFTAEPNAPHLPVMLYYALGKAAAWTAQKPEWVMATAGSLFAFLLTLLLFLTVRLFLPSTRAVWWTFGILMVGGGLGAHLKLVGRFEAVRNNFIARRLIVEPIFDPATAVFEDFRGHYIFATLFDTHHLVNWLTATVAVLSLYFALRRFSLLRLLAMTTLYALATALHVYEGVTLAAVTAGVAYFCWRKRLLRRREWVTLAAGPAAAFLTLTGLYLLQQLSGLPVSPWRAPGIFLAIVLLAYPLAWLVIAWGFSSFWPSAGLRECFLLGWAAGCTVLTLSGPYYPYPDRGTMTMQIPLYLIAGLIYFSRFERMRLAHAVLALALTAATPSWLLLKWREQTRFRPDAPQVFLSSAHREILRTLAGRSSASDVLLADLNETLWLAPEYNGKHYCGHFFLTVHYDRKRAAVSRFFAAGPEQQAALLEREGIRFLYVAARQNPERFTAVPGLKAIAANSAGALFEYEARKL